VPGPRTRRDRPVLSERDRRRRELSQNYLRSAGAAQFLRHVDADPAGLCLEVGAGEGILTERLASMFAELVAYEVDPAAAGRLEAGGGGRGGGGGGWGGVLAG
jgi:23S rRNA (adenine-N6)-dimethyltransferase